MKPLRSVGRAVLVTTIVLLSAPGTTGQSPQLLVDGNPLPGASSFPTSFGRGPVDGTLTLVFNDGVNGNQLWLTDGTSAGTVQVTSFATGATVIFRWFVTMADLTVFVVERGGNPELWRTDGTPAGTFLLHAGTASSGLLYPVADVAHGPVLFFADNGVTWRTDGTVAGTYSLGVPDAQWEGVLFGLTLLLGVQGEVIVSDGSTAAVIGSLPGGVVFTVDGLYQLSLVFAPPLLGFQITALHLPGNPGTFVPYPATIAAASSGGVLIANATGLSHWNGSGPPQQLITWSSFSPPVLGLGASTVFTANVPGLGAELVLSDGTLAGTRTLDLQPGATGSSPVLVGQIDDRLLLWANAGGLGSEPHLTDGTSAGTVHLGDLEPGPAGSSIGGWTPVGQRRALLAVQTTVLGKEPWITDGTSAGTQLLADIAPGAASSLITIGGIISNVGMPLGGAIVLMADDGVHGREPWVLPVTGSHLAVQRYSTRRFDVDDPVLGSSVALTCRSLQPSDLGLVAVGQPLGKCAPIAPRRCLHFDPFAAFAAAVVIPASDGTWNGSFALPNLPSAVGVDFVVQAIFVDAAQPLGVDVGDAHWWSLGF
ncbi:MAG: hypothetical protein JNL08_12875 [Planctomycetes bacterium]|nr:hypothetical protein [Planctomycetota bacterium]